MANPILINELLLSEKRKANKPYRPIHFRLFGQFPDFQVENRKSQNGVLIFTHTAMNNKIFEVHMDSKNKIIGKVGTSRLNMRPYPIHNAEHIRVFQSYLGLDINKTNQLRRLLTQVFQTLRSNGF